MFRPKIARDVHDLEHRKLRKRKLRGRKLRGHGVDNRLDMSTSDIFRHVYLSTKNYVKSYLFETLLPITHDFSAATAW